MSVISYFEIYRDIIPDYKDFLDAINTAHPSHLRINTLKTTAGELIERFSAYDCSLTPLLVTDAFSFSGLVRPGATLEYFLGHYHLQGLSSVLPPLVLAPVEDEHILDMCASPGSKTTQIAAMTSNRCTLIANELNQKRLPLLKFHLDRLGVLNTIVTNYQAQNFPTKYPDGTPMRFDKILLDAPCSGEGRYRVQMRVREMEKMRGFTTESSSRLSRYQRQMILKGFDLLREGGILTYSTCTYSPLENEMVIDYLLQNRSSAHLEPVEIEGIHTVPGCTAWRDLSFRDSLCFTVRIYPHYLDSWGFYIARIRKLGN